MAAEVFGPGVRAGFYTDGFNLPWKFIERFMLQVCASVLVAKSPFG